MSGTEDEYWLLNEALCSVLFDGRFAGRPLYLDMESDLLGAAAEKAGFSPEEFSQRAAACAGQILTGTGPAYSLYGFAREARRWLRQGGTGFPSFALLLSVLSMAAETMQADAQFSANNYYERLYALTGITGQEDKARTRNAFKATRYLWEAFNEWLRRHDGALGLPTAAAVIPAWTYVSYPISQALVRDADRQRLVRMFEHYGLNPGEPVQAEEMEDYLEEWIPSPDSGTWLKTLWSKSDLRQKIAQTACLELISWEGGGPVPETGQARQNITAFLQIGGWLKEELHILLCIAAGTADSAKASGRIPGFSSAASPFEGMDLLVPNGELFLSEALAAGFEVAAEPDGQALVRRGRPIIPFAQSPAGPGYREASRTSLLGDYLILCHKLWLNQTEAHLRNYARPGWTKLDSSAMAGLPDDWLLFRKVEFLSAPQANVPASLQCLVPLSESSLRIDGGLPLAGDDWHLVPGVRLHGTAASGKLKISIHDPLSQSPHPIAETARAGAAPILLAGSSTGLKSGNYEARLSSEGRIIRTLRFGLKDASKPRPDWSLSGVPPVSYASSAARPLRALGSADADGPEGSVCGLITAGHSAFGNPTPEVQPAAEPPEGGEEPELAGHSGTLSAAEGIEDSCAIRGHHVWECQPFRKGDDPKDPKWQTCHGCSTTVILKKRGRIQRKKRGRNVRRRAAPAAQTARQAISTPAPAPGTEAKRPVISSNTLLDALFYLGGGRGTRLARISASAGTAAWAGTEFARNLIALGHIDASLSLPSGTIDYWRASPPVLCEIAPGRGFLAGFRSAAMITALLPVLKSSGAGIESQPQELAPDAIFITAGSGSSLEELVRTAEAAVVNRLHHVRRPGAAIAAMYPPASAMLQALPEASPDASRPIERFNVRKSKWETCAAPGEPGAYRTVDYVRRYYFADASQRTVAAPFAIAKALAAREEGIYVHGYRRGEFVATLGCQPPAMLERALIACSGLLPRREGGRIIYSGVDEQTASLVLDRLYSSGGNT